MNPVSGSVLPSSAAGSGAVGLGAGAAELAFGFAAVSARPGQKAPILSALPIFRAAAAATAGSGRSAPLKLKLDSGLLGGDARWGEELGIIFSISQRGFVRKGQKSFRARRALSWLYSCTVQAKVTPGVHPKLHPRTPKV